MSVTGKTVLIISGGMEAVPIIEEARSLGLKVAVSDGSSDAPGLKLADERIIASTYDAAATVGEAVELNKRTRIDGVLAAAADVPMTVAAVASKFGLPGPGEKSARLCADKFLMKEALREAGVPVPWYSLVECPGHLDRIINERDGEIVIKPVDSRGARGVVRMIQGIDPVWAYNEALANSPTGRVMAEEWVEGRQVSTESIVANGRVVTPGLSDRNYEYLDHFAPYIIENGGDLPADLSVTEKEEIDALILKVAGALGIANWTIKGDVVVTEDGPVVIEVAPRLSGGYFCTHTAPLSTGVNLVEAAILLALGETVDLTRYTPGTVRHVTQRFLFPEPGVVTSVVAPPDEVVENERVEMFRLYVKPGDVVPRMVSHPCRSGTVTTTGRTREEAQRAAREVIENTVIITGPESAKVV